MRDFSLPYLKIKKLLDEFYKAAIVQDKDRAYLLANNIVEEALKLEDITHAD
jgi:L-rhamnose isomerase